MKNSTFLLLKTQKHFAMSVLLCFAALSSSYGQVDLTISDPSDNDIQIGDVFTVTIGFQTDASQEMDTNELYMNYDPAILKVNSVSEVNPGTTFSNIIANDFSTPGQITYSAFVANSMFPSGSFDYLTIEFEALADGTTDFNFNFNESNPIDRHTQLYRTGVYLINTPGPTKSILVGDPLPFELCIASGAGVLNPSDGRTYEEDTDTNPHPTRTGGSDFAAHPADDIGSLTGDDLILYETEIFGAYSYNIPVTNNGIYKVELFLAEIYIGSSYGGADPAAPGLRVFDIAIEGNVVLDEFDMLDTSKGGFANSLMDIQRTYFVNVTDNTLNIVLSATVDNAKLSGLCVTEMTGENPSPILNLGDLNAEVGVAAALALNITDNDPISSLNVTLNNLPSGLSYNSTTGQIEGTPAAGTAGTYTIYALVNDGNSSDVTGEFDITVATGTQTDILGFSFAEQTGPATIDDINHTVNIEVNAGANLSSLVPTIGLSEGATVDPASGVAGDFSSPNVAYTVTAEDGTTQQVWTITVTQATASTEEFDLGNFKLYPNPAHKTDKYITLEISQGQGTIKNISIFDMGGRLIENRDVEKLNLNKETIEVHAYARGMYFLNVVSTQGKKSTAKFYVQ